jgi:hypothetical protein
MRVYSPEQMPDQARSIAAPQDSHINWWLRLTSSGWNQPQLTIQEREKARRSRLTAWIVLGLFIVDGVLVPTTFNDPTSLIGVVVAAVTLLIVAALNRAGFVTVAGSVLVVMIVAIVFGVVVGVSADPVIHAPAGQLSLTLLPSYDLLAMAVLVAASILPRAATFIVAGANSVLIYVDFLLQPHAHDLQAYVILRGPAVEVVRPIALQIIIATVAYLWVRGTDEAIRRADRAEDLAAMEHQLAEQKRQLDLGIRGILDTHVRIANGDYGARAPLTQDNILFQIAASLNTLLNRLGRAAQAEYFMQRTTSEIARLRESLIAARAGRQPLWPAPSGTPVDSLIEVLAAPSMQRPPSQLPPSGMPGVGTAGLNPAHAANSGPFPPPGAGSQPMGGTPYGSPGEGLDPWGQTGSRGTYFNPQGGRPMGAPEFGGGADPATGMSGANSGPGWQDTSRSTSWELPDMPPLPDWLVHGDDER